MDIELDTSLAVCTVAPSEALLQYFADQARVHAELMAGEPALMADGELEYAGNCAFDMDDDDDEDEVSSALKRPLIPTVDLEGSTIEEDIEQSDGAHGAPIYPPLEHTNPVEVSSHGILTSSGTFCLRAYAISRSTKVGSTPQALATESAFL